MPIYQYKCSHCDHRMEALQKISDPLLTDCPACDTAGLRKQLTAAAFKLNGTGWYETDFKNSGKQPESKQKPEANDDKPKTDKNASDKTADAAS